MIIVIAIIFSEVRVHAFAIVGDTAVYTTTRALESESLTRLLSIPCLFDLLIIDESYVLSDKKEQS